MRLKIGINGVGRIGSSFARIALQKDLFDIVLINTRFSTPEKILSLLQDDYVYGKFDKNITFKDQSLVIENKEIAINKTENLEENLNRAIMTIKVNRSWVAENSLEKENISLFRFNETGRN